MFKKISDWLWDNYARLRVKTLFEVGNQGICACFCLVFRKISAIDESLNSLGFNVVLISGSIINYNISLLFCQQKFSCPQKNME